MSSVKNQITTSNIIVQKYGGATLATPEKIIQVAKRIFKLSQSGKKVVVVVSAMGQTTNQLIELAHQVAIRPPLRELDMLLSVGERISMSLLSMALNELGCAAISFTGSQAGILTDDSHVNANIIDVKAFRIDQALQENKVVILAGFQGVSAKTKEITTLGRGGSDITAVAMAGYLNAERCEILKDVDAVFTSDPKIVKSAKPINHLTYKQLLDMTQWGAKVLHFQSVKFASDKNVKLFVGSAANDTVSGTLISNSLNENSKTNEAQKVLAINSFKKVFAIKLENNSFENFQNYLQENQIGQVQFLYQNKNLFYFTAPDEVLSDIEKIQINPTYSLHSNSLSSVSATFREACLESQLTICRENLLSNAIKPLESFHSGCSAHFIIKADDRDTSIKVLHSLSES